MRLSAVVAATENDVIGRGNQMPWHLPADLSHFKRLTLGKPVLMGRRTFESIGRPLPGRLNLVLSRRGFAASGVVTVSTLDEAMRAASDAPEMAVIGGADVFRLAMPQLDVLYLTRIHAHLNGDTFLPPLDPAQWREVSREWRAADERNVYAMSFITLERIKR
ncbi:MAG: dihydrofolate reductase [Nevskiaceae bacterium]|jgi:dihydrofolate reductase|nr:dihydrofolate reductase [Nevskiaceae bacterium]